jgi:hypothetical protein
MTGDPGTTQILPILDTIYPWASCDQSKLTQQSLQGEKLKGLFRRSWDYSTSSSARTVLVSLELLPLSSSRLLFLLTFGIWV